MLTRRSAFTLLAALAASATAVTAVAQQADNSRYILFLHAGAPPDVHDANAHLLAVLNGLRKAGYLVRKPDSDRDDVGGPGVDYFDDNDLAAAQAVADIVNAAMPDSPKKIAPRRQRVKNPPYYLGVWLF
jgi:hypothetical protein